MMKQLGVDTRQGMSTIVQTVSRWLSPFIILYGIFGLAVGNEKPGGAFENGVILACGFVLLMLASGKAALIRRVPVKLVSALLCIGAIIFWISAASGMFFGHRFFTNFLAQKNPPGSRGTGIIIFCEIGIFLAVASALVLLLVALSVLRVKSSGTDEEFITDVEE